MGIDCLGNPLGQSFAIEQQKHAAGGQQKHHAKCNDYE
jgi:hypothetical protein